MEKKWSGYDFAKKLLIEKYNETSETDYFVLTNVNNSELTTQLWDRCCGNNSAFKQLVLEVFGFILKRIRIFKNE